MTEERLTALKAAHHTLSLQQSEFARVLSLARVRPLDNPEYSKRQHTVDVLAEWIDEAMGV